MVEKRISATELAKQLSDVMNRVAYRGEQFVVERNGEPVCRIVPARQRTFRLSDLVRLVKEGKLAPPDDQFARDVEDVIRNQGEATFPEWDTTRNERDFKRIPGLKVRVRPREWPGPP